MLFNNETNNNVILIKSSVNNNKDSKAITFNKHGLDTEKFQLWLNRLHKEIVNYSPEQFENELYRMARETKKKI